MPRMWPLPANLKPFAERVLDLVFTPRCVGCRREGAYLCGRCLDKARPLHHPYRPGNLPAIEGVLSCFAMESAVREAVHHLKYRGLKAIAPPIGKLLAERVTTASLAPEVVVPVPLHPKRLRQRGYNQAELLAVEAARPLELPVMAGAVRRVSHGPPQALSASVEERWAAVRGAFEPGSPTDGRRVLLVDDVCTTGATLHACAMALKAAGAASVWGLTFAREV